MILGRLSIHRGWIKWAVAVVVLLLVAGGVLRALSQRKAQQQALAASTSARESAPVELAASDVVMAQTMDLRQGLPVSGSLKAVSSAVIKARVAGELQGLTLREGDFVKAGQIIARIDASEYRSRVRQASEQAASAKAQVDVVQRQYDNNKALVDQGFISKTALDTSLANLNAAQSTYKAAQAATEVASKSVDDTVLRSPLAGQVSQRLAQPGERVGIDAKIIEIVDLSRLELEATLSAADAAQVRVGQSAELQIEGSAQRVNAKVARINPSAQAGSRSILAYLSIDNADAATALPLRQGLFAQGTLGTGRAALLSVPLSSVRTDKPAPYVQAISNGQVAHLAVELGARGTVGADSDCSMTTVPELIALCGRRESENTRPLCSDRQDNDGDMLTDCADPDCAASQDANVRAACDGLRGPENTLERCMDGFDNDDNRFIDCRDFGCSRSTEQAVQDYCASLSETGVDRCRDGIDNDRNGFVDCRDFSCSQSIDPEVIALCGAGETTLALCMDGRDNDTDGFVDCADRDCTSATSPAVSYCTERAEDSLAECSDGVDNDRNGYVDCADRSCTGNAEANQYCVTVVETTFARCRDGIDNDRNGYSDCADRGCQGVIEFGPDNRLRSPCQEDIGQSDETRMAACADGIDNDQDGFVDCADWDCSWGLATRNTVCANAPRVCG